MKKWLLWTFAIIAGILGVIGMAIMPFLIPLAMLYISFTMQSNDLAREAKVNDAYLSNLTILDDQKTIVTPRQNGEGLTGGSAPATASFTVNTTMQEAYDEIARNLKKQGFSITDQYSTDTGAYNLIPSVYIKAITVKDNQVIVLQFNLEEPVDCYKLVEECKSFSLLSLEESRLLEEKLTSVDIWYDDDRNPLYNIHFQ